jgi:hypothetical protein
VSDPPRGAPVPPDTAAPASRRRPMIERIGLALIAAAMATMFGAVASLAWVGGEPFLAIMAAIGCLMTAWVGVLTLFRG